MKWSFSRRPAASRSRRVRSAIRVGRPPPPMPRLIRDYTDRAVECLRKAKARGFADVVGLETDPDLEPIRDEPGFRALIAEFPRPAAAKR